MNAREVALELLLRWRRGRALADELLDEIFAQHALSALNRALATELFYGCLRQKLYLEHVFSVLELKRPSPAVTEILKLGIYQLLFLPKIPAFAAVNETTALAKRAASGPEAGFVNAVLRRVVAERQKILNERDALRAAQPWIYHSHPRWLHERWRKNFGDAETDALCEWNNAPPPIFVRLNTLKAEKISHEIVAEPSQFHPLCYKIAENFDVFSTKSWQNGELYAQDPSALMAVDMLDPQMGESVLDVCAAPGGKTTYIAQKMRNLGEIIAADSAASRLGKVAENCRRLGVTMVATMPCAATHLAKCLRNSRFDRVLVDAPCSNTGVLRRRADLRWRLKESEISRLAALQQKILEAAAALTKSGGALVYSTCSLEREENEAVVEKFLKTHKNFKLEETRATFPPREKVDGAFAARLRKTN
jgi:16S rRNA (cytosine967-C5)-methyltransferase